MRRQTSATLQARRSRLLQRAFDRRQNVTSATEKEGKGTDEQTIESGQSERQTSDRPATRR